tara:strand:- start:1185 stop:1361 length:177 start_codon:yes stop_codon:yes gene_type:complete
MNHEDTDAGLSPASGIDRASVHEDQSDQAYSSLKGCLTLVVMILAFLGASIGLAILTK